MVILGEGDERASLEAKIDALGLGGKVMMPGYLIEASRYLAFFRVFVVSSSTEGLPIAILEAMRAGIPIVSTRVGGIPDALGNGSAGILVQSARAEDLKEGILKIINDESLGGRLAANAKKRLNEKFTSEKMALKYTQVYRTVTSGGGCWQQMSKTGG